MRNMIKANQAAFAHLIDILNNDFGLRVSSAKRYFKSNFQEKDILKNAKLIKTLKLQQNLTIVSLEYKNETYITIIGLHLDNAQVDIEHFNILPLNSALLTILLSEKIINFHQGVNAIEFEDLIMHQHEDPIYKGHLVEDFTWFLQPITLVKIERKSILREKSLQRILCNILTTSKEATVINFEDCVYKFINDLTLIDSYKLSFELVLNCLLASNFKFAFLELYKAIERLFPISYLKEFYYESKSTRNFIDFVATLEKITSWRPKEDEALNKVFNSASKSSTILIMDLAKAKGYNENHYNYVYKLRNSIVHFRMFHENIHHNDEEWNDLLYGILQVIHEQYFKFKEILKDDK